MRGVLCLLILYWHLTPAPHARPGLSLQLAVDVFFILSGFVIAYAFERRAPALGAGRLIAIRLIRLYPLFLLSLVIAVGLQTIAGQPVHGLLPNLALLPMRPTGFWIAPFFPLNIPAWSLCAEVLINVVFALIWSRVRLPLWVLALVVAVSAALLVAVALRYRSLDVGWGWQSAIALPIRVGFGFSAGVLIQRLFERGIRAPANPAIFVLILAAAPLLLVHTNWPVTPLWEAFYVVVIAPLCVWIGASALSGPIMHHVARWSARLSYAIYAIHYPIVTFARGYPKGWEGAQPLSSPVMTVLLGALVVLIAWAAEALYDRPVRRFLTARLGMGLRQQA